MEMLLPITVHHYYDGDNLTRIERSDGSWVKFEYDDKGRCTKDENSEGEVVIRVYGSFDQPHRIIYNNGIEVVNAHNTKGQLIMEQVYMDGKLHCTTYHSYDSKERLYISKTELAEEE